MNLPFQSPATDIELHRDMHLLTTASHQPLNQEKLLPFTLILFCNSIFCGTWSILKVQYMWNTTAFFLHCTAASPLLPKLYQLVLISGSSSKLLSLFLKPSMHLDPAKSSLSHRTCLSLALCIPSACLQLASLSSTGLTC